MITIILGRFGVSLLIATSTKTARVIIHAIAAAVVPRLGNTARYSFPLGKSVFWMAHR
jgi:hypothetical protein